MDTTLCMNLSVPLIWYGMRVPQLATTVKPSRDAAALEDLVAVEAEVAKVAQPPRLQLQLKAQRDALLQLLKLQLRVQKGVRQPRLRHLQPREAKADQLRDLQRAGRPLQLPLPQLRRQREGLQPPQPRLQPPLVQQRPAGQLPAPAIPHRQAKSETEARPKLPVLL